LSLPVVESNLLIGLWNLLLALVTLGILWNARDRAVYCWSLSGALGGLYLCLSAPWTGAAFYLSTPGQWLLSGLVVGGALLKVVAIGVLTNHDWPEKVYWRSAAALGGVILAAPLLLPERRWVSLLTLALTIVLMVLFVMRAFAFGRRLQLNNAKFFAVMIGLQAGLAFFVTLVFLLVGDDPLVPSREPQTFGGMLLFLTLGLLNNALFIALVFDVNVLRANSVQQQLLQATAEQSKQAERERMLADMHDGLGSQLATARLKVELGQITQAEVAELLRECMADLYLMVDTLRHKGTSLAEALVDYRFRTERRVTERGLVLDWQVDLDAAPAMPATTLLQVLRIVQESLNNALKYSRAARITIGARYSRAGYEVWVEDNGVGLPDPPSEGRGLANMRRRARDLGASLRVERGALGVGTLVALSLPLTTGVAPA